MKSSDVVATVLLMAASTLVVPLSSAAQPASGWYIGGSLGQGRSNNSSGDLAASLAALGITGTGTTSDRETGGKFFLGYQFNEYYAVEGGYFNLGTYRASGSTTAPAASIFGISSKIQGANIDVVGILPFGQGFAGLGRFGVAYLSSNNDVAFSNVAVGARYGNPSKNTTVGQVGLGLQYQFTPSIAGRLEWQRMLDVVDRSAVTTDIDFYSVGITVRF